MARKASSNKLDTRSARLKLKARREPYWVRVESGSYLGYRTSGRKGEGSRVGHWLARYRDGEGKQHYKAIGPADDVSEADGAQVLTFDQAQEQARTWFKEAAAEVAGPAPTVRSAVEIYTLSRDARDSRRAGRPKRSDASHRLARYVIGQRAGGKRPEIAPAPLAAVPLHGLKERDLLAWRETLPDDLKATTLQRLINDLKAALNAAYAANRDVLAPTLPAIIKHGLKADQIDDDEAAPLARDNQILADGDIGRILKAAREVDAEQDWEGDLFRLVLVLAATGARFSQPARMRVGDCQTAEGRLMVPVSRKGRGGKNGAIPVPVGRDVIEALLPVVTGRPADAPLLERWRHEQQKGGIAWRRTNRGPWQSASELVRPWHEIRKRAKMPNLIPYALRHSSIVRGIRANLPLRMVAALHDTSTAMIERHYAKYITSGLEDMARSAVVPLVPSEGGADVVHLRKQ